MWDQINIVLLFGFVSIFSRLCCRYLSCPALDDCRHLMEVLFLLHITICTYTHSWPIDHAYVALFLYWIHIMDRTLPVLSKPIAHFLCFVRRRVNRHWLVAYLWYTAISKQAVCCSFTKRVNFIYHTIGYTWVNPLAMNFNHCYV